MKRIINILNKPWALALAFVPVLNLVVLVFCCIVSNRETNDLPSWKIGLVGAPLCVLYPLLPDQWNWLVTYLIVSALAALYIHTGKQAYSPKFRFKWKLATFILIAIAAGVAINFQLIQLGSHAAEQTQEALSAIAEMDEQAWQALIHPRSEKIPHQLQTFVNDLDRQGIRIEKGYRIQQSVIGRESVETGDCVGIEQYFYLRNNRYCVEAMYLSDEEAAGFIKFEIYPIGDADTYNRQPLFSWGKSQKATQMEATLVINGQTVTTDSPCVIRIRYGFADGELPLLEVCDELGIEYWYQKGVVTLQGDAGGVTLDKARDDFGLVFYPKALGPVRKAEGTELILDSGSMEYLLQKVTDVQITVDSEAGVIYVDTVAPEESP